MATALGRYVKLRVLGSPVPAFLHGNGVVTSLGMGPEQATVTGSAWQYTQQPLQGLKALTYKNAPGVKGLTFSHTISTNTLKPSTYVDQRIAQYQALADAGVRVRLISTSAAETAGWWFISDLSIAITSRDENQRAQTATITWTLIEATPSAVPKLGRTAPQSATTGAGRPAPAKAAAAKSTANRRYTVKSGDGLYAIAGALLGSYTRWPEIAQLNHLADPNRLDAGQVLLIPPR